MRKLVSAAIGVGLWALAAAGAADEAPTTAQLRASVAAADWNAVVEAAGAATRARPRDAEPWFYLGIGLREQGRPEEAAPALEQALALGFQPPRTAASLAITHARRGDPEAAFAALGRAVSLGLPLQTLEKRAAFAELRALQGFAAFLAAAEHQAHPCEHDPRYAALDFWMGDWVVRAGEQTVGSNRITKSQRGCAIREQWQATSGTSGESLNYFEPASRRWVQHWVDESGGVIRYVGELRDGAMVFVGESLRPDGSSSGSRMTLTPLGDGTLRQRIEQSTDGGQTWSASFDVLYVRDVAPAKTAPSED